MQYKLVELQPNNRYALTDNNGDYTLQVLANFNGAVNVNCDFNMPTFDITCPDTAGYTITLNGVLDSLTGYDFSSSSSLGPCTHLGITSYATAHRPIASATRYVYITNNSTIPVTNAVVTIEYADTLVWPENINIPAPFTWTLNNNILSVNLPTLMYGQNVQFSYNEEVNDFAQIGMQTTVNLSITPQNTCNVASLGGLNDTYTDITPIVNSYDPNDKQAVPPGQGDNNEVLKTDDIEYIIRFQNLGTDTAFIVKVIDTLSTYFDITTLNIGGATHPFNLELLNNNVLVYTFNNILLPPASVNEEGSIGMFSYKIAQKQSNQVPYQLNNTAHIYFDLNPAVVTNTYTHNVVDVLAVNEDIQVLKTRLYPNPAGNAITITIPGIKNQTASIHLYNASGQLVKAITNIKQQENTIDIANFATGLYYYTVTTVNGFGSGKFAKD
ncbi:MAG: T9SS type A sorting domain-containing protein [Sphingobacteriales bacterium JAD_PAG50586_3]|nr:MAG: T9SS type A sorting domain-containing protein [Sphingobacteriales bacterium JAD_PAG50586_3]